MQGPVITVDVSKGSCHYQPYVSNGHPMRKPKVLHDTVEGFQSLSDLIDTMKDRYECETIPVIFEATGVYRHLIAKQRQTVIRQMISIVLISPKHIMENVTYFHMTSHQNLFIT